MQQEPLITSYRLRAVLVIAVLAATVVCLWIARPSQVVAAAAGQSMQRPSAADSKKAIRRILSRKEFQVTHESSRWEEYRQRAIRWIVSVLEHIFGGLDLSSSRAALTATKLVAWIMALGACGLLIWLLWRNRRKRGSKESDLPTGVSTSEPLSVSEIVKHAAAFAAMEEYEEAFRLSYLAILLALDYRGLIRYRKSGTNWEHVRSLRSSGKVDLSKELEGLTRTFDVTQYGSRVCDSDDYQTCLAAYTRVMEEAA